MKLVEKTIAAAIVMLVMAALVLVALFMRDEVRYGWRGETATGKVTSVSEEFARFTNSKYEGTRPVYRYRLRYAFHASGSVYRGEETTEDGHYRPGDALNIQYLPGAPSHHRILTANYQMLRVCLYVFIPLLVSMVFTSILKHRRAFDLQLEDVGPMG